jgi:hypothetical protein
VQEGLTDNKWISDIRGVLTVGVIAEYLHLWNTLSKVELHLGVEDTHVWRFASNGQFTVINASLKDRWNSNTMGRYGILGRRQNVATSFG